MHEKVEQKGLKILFSCWESIQATHMHDDAKYSQWNHLYEPALILLIHALRQIKLAFINISLLKIAYPKSYNMHALYICSPVSAPSYIDVRTCIKRHGQTVYNNNTYNTCHIKICGMMHGHCLIYILRRKYLWSAYPYNGIFFYLWPQSICLSVCLHVHLSIFLMWEIYIRLNK